MMSSMGVGIRSKISNIMNADKQQYRSNNKVQINLPNSITTSTAGVRGSGESLANLSVSSTNVFSNASDNSTVMLRSNTRQASNGEKAQNDFSNVFNPMVGTSTTQDQLQQFHQQMSAQRQQRRMHRTSGHFVNDEFNNYQKSQQESDLAKQPIFRTVSSFCKEIILCII